MRFRVAAVLVLGALSSPALADGSHAIPMTPIANSTEACMQLSAGIENAKCTSAKRETLPALGAVELWVVRGTDKVRYAVTITAATGKLYMSGSTELLVSDVCTDRGADKCSWLVTDAPKLRALRVPAPVGELAAFELATHYKHLSTGGKPPPVTTFYDGYDVVVCGKLGDKQDLVCRTKHWGGTRTSSCKGTLADNGGVDVSCQAQEVVTILDL
jgi:hypothetical protein